MSAETEKAREKNKAQKEKKAEDARLDDELDDTFPASDPPAATAPGRGVTGPEVKREKS